MSRENLEIVRSALQMFIDTDQLSDGFASDLIWDMSRFRGWPEQPVWHGHEGFREFLDAWRTPYEDWNFAVERILDAAGDQVVALYEQRGQVRGSDTAVSLRGGIVYTVQGGQIRHARVFMHAEEALKAVGLEE